MRKKQLLAIGLIMINISTMGFLILINMPTAEQRMERCVTMSEPTRHQQKYCSIIIDSYLQSKD